MTTFSVGTLTRRPSAFLPALIAMQSSPVLNSQLVINTSVHDSGSQPSVLGPFAVMDTSLTVTFRHSTGCTCHIGELTSFTPSIKTLVQRYGWINIGRR